MRTEFHSSFSLSCRYVTPIRVNPSRDRVKVEPNPANPANWDNARLREFLGKKTGGSVDLEVLCPFESGLQLLRLPDAEFVRRILEANPKFGEKRAKTVYADFWSKLIDARTLARKQKMKKKKDTNK